MNRNKPITLVWRQSKRHRQVRAAPDSIYEILKKLQANIQLRVSG